MSGTLTPLPGRRFPASARLIHAAARSKQAFQKIWLAYLQIKLNLPVFE
jgi:hypothetical protein